VSVMFDDSSDTGNETAEVVDSRKPTYHTQACHASPTAKSHMFALFAEKADVVNGEVMQIGLVQY